MSANELETAQEWFGRADIDFTSARLLSAILGPPETICFLAQQGAEKYLKGYLVWHDVVFRKVHDLLEILNACRSVDEAFGELETHCHMLNPYSVEVRYPGYAFDVTREDARSALVSAEHIRDFVCERLGLERHDEPVTDELLGEIVERVVDALAPEQIILFGSYAEGRATADSDLDLLVVTEQPLSRKDRLARTQDLYRDMPLPIQVITISRQEFEETR
ncbi:MAG: HEPN domain-containing protein, partial [Anaerolineae bacterium]